MAKTLALEPTATDAAELQALIERYLPEMDRVAAQMARDQKKIDALKFETALIAAQTRATMDDLQKTLAQLSVA